MAYKINRNPTFTHEVEFQEPVDGGFETRSFRATFRIDTEDDEEGLNPRDAEAVKTFIAHRWIGVPEGELVDDHGKPLPWSDKLRDQLIAIPYVRLGLLAAYFKAITRGRLGN